MKEKIHANNLRKNNVYDVVNLHISPYVRFSIPMQFRGIFIGTTFIANRKKKQFIDISRFYENNHFPVISVFENNDFFEYAQRDLRLKEEIMGYRRIYKMKSIAFFQLSTQEIFHIVTNHHHIFFP